MFPLKKPIIYLNHNDVSISSFKDIAEIPVGINHPGSFGFVRKNHIHEGIDIYCELGDEVFSMEDGEIVKIIPFTGEIAGSPWWNNTYSILIKHQNYFINYGELIPHKDLFVGQKISKGHILGHITPVLRKDKGRPMNMLHLEAYILNSPLNHTPINIWDLTKKKPNHLLNPLFILEKYINSNSPHLDTI